LVALASMVIVFVSPGAAAEPLTASSVVDVGNVPVVVVPSLK